MLTDKTDTPQDPQTRASIPGEADFDVNGSTLQSQPPTFEGEGIPTTGDIDPRQEGSVDQPPQSQEAQDPTTFLNQSSAASTNPGEPEKSLRVDPSDPSVTLTPPPEETTAAPAELTDETQQSLTNPLVYLSEDDRQKARVRPVQTQTADSADSAGDGARVAREARAADGAREASDADGAREASDAREASAAREASDAIANQIQALKSAREKLGIIEQNKGSGKGRPAFQENDTTHFGSKKFGRQPVRGRAGQTLFLTDAAALLRELSSRQKPFNSRVDAASLEQVLGELHKELEALKLQYSQLYSEKDVDAIAQLANDSVTALSDPQLAAPYRLYVKTAQKNFEYRALNHGKFLKNAQEQFRLKNEGKQFDPDSVSIVDLPFTIRRKGSIQADKTGTLIFPPQVSRWTPLVEGAREYDEYMQTLPPQTKLHFEGLKYDNFRKYPTDAKVIGNDSLELDPINTKQSRQVAQRDRDVFVNSIFGNFNEPENLRIDKIPDVPYAQPDPARYALYAAKKQSDFENLPSNIERVRLVESELLDSPDTVASGVSFPENVDRFLLKNGIAVSQVRERFHNALVRSLASTMNGLLGFATLQEQDDFVFRQLSLRYSDILNESARRELKHDVSDRLSELRTLLIESSNNLQFAKSTTISTLQHDARVRSQSLQRQKADLETQILDTEEEITGAEANRETLTAQQLAEGDQFAEEQKAQLEEVTKSLEESVTQLNQDKAALAQLEKELVDARLSGFSTASNQNHELVKAQTAMIQKLEKAIDQITTFTHPVLSGTELTAEEFTTHLKQIDTKLTEVTYELFDCFKDLMSGHQSFSKVEDFLQNLNEAHEFLNGQIESAEKLRVAYHHDLVHKHKESEHAQDRLDQLKLLAQKPQQLADGEESEPKEAGKEPITTDGDTADTEAREPPKANETDALYETLRLNAAAITDTQHKLRKLDQSLQPLKAQMSQLQTLKTVASNESKFFDRVLENQAKRNELIAAKMKLKSQIDRFTYVSSGQQARYRPLQEPEPSETEVQTAKSRGKGTGASSSGDSTSAEGKPKAEEAKAEEAKAEEAKEETQLETHGQRPKSYWDSPPLRTKPTVLTAQVSKVNDIADETGYGLSFAPFSLTEPPAPSKPSKLVFLFNRLAPERINHEVQTFIGSTHENAWDKINHERKALDEVCRISLECLKSSAVVLAMEAKRWDDKYGLTKDQNGQVTRYRYPNAPSTLLKELYELRKKIKAKTWTPEQLEAFKVKLLQSEVAEFALHMQNLQRYIQVEQQVSTLKNYVLTVYRRRMQVTTLVMSIFGHSSGVHPLVEMDTVTKLIDNIINPAFMYPYGSNLDQLSFNIDKGLSPLEPTGRKSDDMPVRWYQERQEKRAELQDAAKANSSPSFAYRQTTYYATTQTSGPGTIETYYKVATRDTSVSVARPRTASASAASANLPDVENAGNQAPRTADGTDGKPSARTIFSTGIETDGFLLKRQAQEPPQTSTQLEQEARVREVRPFVDPKEEIIPDEEIAGKKVSWSHAVIIGVLFVGCIAIGLAAYPKCVVTQAIVHKLVALRGKCAPLVKWVPASLKTLNWLPASFKHFKFLNHFHFWGKPHF